MWKFENQKCDFVICDFGLPRVWRGDKYIKREKIRVFFSFNIF